MDEAVDLYLRLGVVTPEEALAMTKIVKIPEALPTLDRALELFCAWRDEPQENLDGMRLLDTLGTHSDPDRIWVVGSCAWRPGVLGIPVEDQADIDVVFHCVDAAETWARLLAEKLGDVWISTNVHGGIKIMKNDIGIVDAWGLSPGESIAEMLMYFERAHERVAFNICARPGEVSAMTRIVRVRKHVTIDDHYGYGS